MRRIGIYAGTFDPVHQGHLSFARTACELARLSVVYLLPERSPRAKPSARPYRTRVARLHDITDDQIKVLELPDEEFSVARTLPALRRQFPGAQLVMLVGSDVVEHMSSWPDISELVRSCEFAIGQRDAAVPPDTHATLQALGIDSSRHTIVSTPHNHLSSTMIRQGHVQSKST